jgi:hypothetical protein
VTRTVPVALLVRVAFGVVGVAVMAVAVWGILRDRGETDPLGLAIWLGGGVVLHDFVLAPVVLLLGVGVVRVVPASMRAPVVVGLVSAGTLVLVGVPIVLASHRQVANPTVLPGNYLLGLVGALAAVAVLTAARVGWIAVRRRRGQRGASVPPSDLTSSEPG